jgi:GNAT superfamily N-acetyltransferase
VALGYVRPARPDEAGEIARIQLATWRIAFRRLIPRQVLDDLDADWLSARWREAITAPPSPRHRVLLAIEQAETSKRLDLRSAHHSHAETAEEPAAYPVGFLAAGPADEAALAPAEERLDPGVAAITDLLVEPRWARRGHGSRLLAAGVDNWRQDGFRTAVAWAYEQDPATRRFLASAGWEPDGARRALDVDDLLVPQLRLHVSLDPPAGS